MIEFSDDFYALLEVSPLATQDEIKKAYHTLAKKYHPDVYHGPDAEARFQKINYAFEILRDPKKRIKYDSFISSIKNKKTETNKEKKEEDFSDYFTDPVDVKHNFYTELDLELFANEEDIKFAFKKLTEKYNPDNSFVPNAREKIKKITYAYIVLSDPNLKERYDYLLKILVKFSSKEEKKQNQSSSSSQYSKNTSDNYVNNSNDAQNKSNKTQNTNQQKNDNSNSGKYTSSNQQKYSSTKYDENKNYSYKNTSKDSDNGCLKKIVLFVLFALFAYLLKIYFGNRNDNSFSNFQLTKTVITSNSTFSGTKIFRDDSIELEVGKSKYLYYSLPNNQKYTYYYDSDYVGTFTNHDRITITAKKEGKTTITMYNEKKQVVDKCDIYIKSANNKTFVPTKTISINTKTPRPTSTKNIPTNTPTAISEWSFEFDKLNIKVGESVELHFTKPPYAVYSYIPEKSGIFSTTDINSSTVLITGAKSGTCKLYLRNSSNQIVATCTITVSGKSTAPQTPTPLPRKQGGYTEQELIQNGHTGIKKLDGTMYYPGFYQAPNGNYFPTGNQ